MTHPSRAPRSRAKNGASVVMTLASLSRATRRLRHARASKVACGQRHRNTRPQRLARVLRSRLDADPRRGAPRGACEQLKVRHRLALHPRGARPRAAVRAPPLSVRHPHNGSSNSDETRRKHRAGSGRRQIVQAYNPSPAREGVRTASIWTPRTAQSAQCLRTCCAHVPH